MTFRKSTILQIDLFSLINNANLFQSHNDLHFSVRFQSMDFVLEIV